MPETYSYRIQRKGYKSIRGTVTMDGTEKTIAAEWTALTAWTAAWRRASPAAPAPRRIRTRSKAAKSWRI